MRRVLQAIDTRVKEVFAQHGLLYVSNLHDGNGFGKSWQATYETDDRQEVERLLVERGTEFAWQSDGGLRTVTRAPAVRCHPITGLDYWGNQAVNWHWATLPNSAAASLMTIFKDPWNFPKSVFLGSGKPIDPEDVRHVRRVLDDEEITFSWKQGDVLMVDNHCIAHGRRPFSGNRKILVAMH
jgi:alpha-ketoglutarate-dependent taurine dioxygenase